MSGKTYDTGSILADLRDVQGKGIRGRCRFTLVNQHARSLNRSFEVVFGGRPLPIKGDIPAGPVGIYQIFITPEKYREKNIFLMVPTDKPAQIEEIFFVEPGEVSAKLPTYSTVKQKASWKRLFAVLDNSSITASKYGAMANLKKAGMFNLFAKMEATPLPDKTTVFDHVKKIRNPKPARFFAYVGPALLKLVRADREGFHAVPGALHNFPPGWQRLNSQGSFKTPDRAGNLQLTFAKNSKGEFLVDADIDDHQGIQHAFDVIKHKVTGKDTHPYDIHQILNFFQVIDPGYLLG